MTDTITWYDTLGILPGASAGEIEEAYQAKARLLSPELVAGAPSPVAAAASRAARILDAARRVLADPAVRERYDSARGIRSGGGGLAGPGGFPSEPGWGIADFDTVAGRPGAEVLGRLMLLADWLAPHSRLPARITVPDIRGLFHSVCLAVLGRLGLRVAVVRLTARPLPVDGLVVGQSPLPQARLHRYGQLTVQVWHPAQDTPGGSDRTEYG